HSPGDYFPVGMTTVTYTATDAQHNTATCPFTVTVDPGLFGLGGLNPLFITAGGPTFTLFVGGSNIVNGAAVAWNGELRPTVNVNCNAIAATIPASDIAATGQNISTATISVVDPASGMPYVPDWGTATFLFTIVSS